MPELPEVETIARQLRGLVVDRTISEFESRWVRLTEPEPAEVVGARLRALLHRRPRAAIKVLLLDQRAIAGIGNIYAIEALWRARIHPLRKAGSLRAEEIARLHEAIRWALRKGIRLGGASPSDYVDARGNKGRMQREFQVYQRPGEPCPRCGRAIVRTVVGGRGTFHCPRCQRAPRPG